MTTCVQPESAISRKSRCRSQLSGVVCSVFMNSSPIMLPFVPTSPTFASRQTSSMCFVRYVVVVLPFVPVTPMTVISEDGSWKKFRDAMASANRLSFTITYGTSQSGASPQRTQTAPFFTAEPMYLCPSVSKPLTATNRLPGPALRESYATSAISSSSGACSARTSISRSNSLSFNDKTPPVFLSVSVYSKH